MKNRDIMFAALVLAVTTFCVLSAALLRQTDEISPGVYEYSFEEADFTAYAAENPAVVPEEENLLVSRNIFSSLRGKKAEIPDPPEPENVPEVVVQPEEPPKVEVKYNMLGAYPNDWPRFKLLGVSCVDGRYTAIIRGAPILKVTQGPVFARNYTIGDDLSGGVVLHEVKIEERLVLLRRGNDVLTIKLGVEPPEVPSA